MLPTLDSRLREAVARVRANWRGTRFVDGLEPGPEGTRALLDLARIYRANKAEISRLRPLEGRSVVGLFFDPSLRTHASMEVATGRLGAHFVHLQGGSGTTWQMAFEDGAVMDGAAEEHVREAAPVLSSYGDVLAVRAGPRSGPRDESVVRAFVTHAGAPLLNLESALAHPCQGLADQLTLCDLGGGSFAGRKVCLTWTPHPRPLPQSVPLAVVRAAVLGGADLHIAAPEGYALDPAEVGRASSFGSETGARVSFTQDPDAAAAGALAVYACGWDGPPVPDAASWTVTAARLRTATAFLHSLPIRRGVVATDAVLDGPKSRVVPQAANREPTQAALLMGWLL
jgi:N-acetylornithine carbamoyltransferase